MLNKKVEESIMTDTFRKEKDSLGVKNVPEDVYYGVQSLRAAENFQITGLSMHPEIINSLAYIKKAAAITNFEVGLLDKPFVDNCVSGITANETRCRYLVENSVGVITAICPHVGYQSAADIAKKALKTGESVRTLILKEGLLTEHDLDNILDPVHMTEPGISGKELLKKHS